MLKFDLQNITIHATEIHELEVRLRELLISNSEANIITTFNLDFLRLAENDKEFHKICNNSLFNLPDGFGITSLIKLKYKKNISRITGNDIFPLLLKLAKQTDKKVAIIGGSEQVSKITKQKIETELSFDSTKLLCLSPPFNFESNYKQNKSVINKIISFNPDIVFAALGCPRQEKWLYNNMNKFGSKINIGIGATLDFFSGQKKRSPIILQKFGLEWFWRLITEPKRLFRRYILEDIPFFIKRLKDFL